MKFKFLPEADEEFREASSYYENEAPGSRTRRQEINEAFHAKESIRPAG